MKIQICFQIFTYWQSELPIVAITDYKLAHKVFIKDGESFSDRYDFTHVDKHTKGGNYGVIFTSGPMWKEHRRFGLKVFRDFGVGKNQMQEIVSLN